MLVEQPELDNGVKDDGHNRNRFIRQHQIPMLAPFQIDLASADDFGSTKVISLPDTNLIIASVGLIGSFEKVPGFPNATDFVWGFGTAPASNATLSGDMINLLTGSVSGSGSEFSLGKGHSNENATPALIYIPDAADSIYFNMSATLSAAGSMLFSGTLNIWYFDVGNVGS